MTQEDTRGQLLKPLDDFIAGRSDFASVYPGWYFAFFRIRDEELSPHDLEFFTEVQEKLEYTHYEDPDADSRRDGWIGSDEFRTWLTEHRRKLDQ
jgi:hypothetical protein